MNLNFKLNRNQFQFLISIFNVAAVTLTGSSRSEMEVTLDLILSVV